MQQIPGQALEDTACLQAGLGNALFFLKPGDLLLVRVNCTEQSWALPKEASGVRVLAKQDIDLQVDPGLL